MCVYWKWDVPAAIAKTSSLKQHTEISIAFFAYRNELTVVLLFVASKYLLLVVTRAGRINTLCTNFLILVTDIHKFKGDTIVAFVEFRCDAFI